MVVMYAFVALVIVVTFWKMFLRYKPIEQEKHLRGSRI